MNTRGLDTECERFRSAARLLYQGSRKIRVLKLVGWSPEVKAAFSAAGAQQLPRVDHPAFDPEIVIGPVREAWRFIHEDGVVDQWLGRHVDALERSAWMLAALGTADFFEHSRQIYGEPTAPLLVFPKTPMELAESVHSVIDQLTHIAIDIAPPAYHAAASVAQDIERAVRAHFGDAGPDVELVDALSANAVATPSAIRIRRDARFTDRDAIQLLNHEAYIHCATSLNGAAQNDLPILAAGHPRALRTAVPQIAGRAEQRAR